MVEKAKKVTLRDVVRNELAGLIMEARGEVFIDRTKEGLVIREGSETLVIRVIQKKDMVERKDVVETITLKDLEERGILATEEQKWAKEEEADEVEEIDENA